MEITWKQLKCLFSNSMKIRLMMTMIICTVQLTAV